MLQDFDKGRESEIDFMNGAIVREAAAQGIPCARERHDHPARQGCWKRRGRRDQRTWKRSCSPRVDREELVRAHPGPRAHRFRHPAGNGRHGAGGRAPIIADWIRRELALEPLVEEVAPGRQNIIVTLDSGAPGPCLMLEGHTDVVSEGSREDWTHDPFGGEVADGRIYGRGACDMKAGLAVALVTARHSARRACLGRERSAWDSSATRKG